MALEMAQERFAEKVWRQLLGLRWLLPIPAWLRRNNKISEYIKDAAFLLESYRMT